MAHHQVLLEACHIQSHYLQTMSYYVVYFHAVSELGVDFLSVADPGEIHPTCLLQAEDRVYKVKVKQIITGKRSDSGSKVDVTMSLVVLLIKGHIDDPIDD